MRADRARWAGFGLAAVLVLAGGCGGPEDACGNDLSGLESTVLGLDPHTGAVLWSVEAPPLVPHGIYDAASGRIRYPRFDRRQGYELDAATGVAPDDAPAPTVVIDTSDPNPPATWDGVAALATADGGANVVIATDPATGAELWRFRPPRPGGVGVDAGGDVAVVVSNESWPSCY